MVKSRKTELASLARVERAIHVARGQKVMLDSDLAEAYVATIGKRKTTIDAIRVCF